MRLGLVLGYGNAFGRLLAVGDAVGAGVGVWGCLWAVSGGWRCGWGWCWGMGMPLGGYWRLEMRLGLVLGYGNAFGRLLAVGDAVGAGVGVWGCLWGRVRARGVWRGRVSGVPPLFKRPPGPQVMLEHCRAYGGPCLRVHCFLDFGVCLFTALLPDLLRQCPDEGLVYYTDRPADHPLTPYFEARPARLRFLHGDLRFEGAWDATGLVKLQIRRHAAQRYVWRRDPAQVRQYGFTNAIGVTLHHRNVTDHLLRSPAGFDLLVLPEASRAVMRQLLPPEKYAALRIRCLPAPFFAPAPGAGDSGNAALTLLNLAVEHRARSVATLAFGDGRHDNMMDEIFCWPEPYPEAVHLFCMELEEFEDILPWFSLEAP